LTWLCYCLVAEAVHGLQCIHDILHHLSYATKQSMHSFSHQPFKCDITHMHSFAHQPISTLAHYYMTSRATSPATLQNSTFYACYRPSYLHALLRECGNGIASWYRKMPMPQQTR
jgi:hypothetical protein